MTVKTIALTIAFSGGIEIEHWAKLGQMQHKKYTDFPKVRKLRSCSANFDIFFVFKAN